MSQKSKENIQKFITELSTLTGCLVELTDIQKVFEKHLKDEGSNELDFRSEYDKVQNILLTLEIHVRSLNEHLTKCFEDEGITKDPTVRSTIKVVDIKKLLDPMNLTNEQFSSIATLNDSSVLVISSTDEEESTKLKTYSRRKSLTKRVNQPNINGNVERESLVSHTPSTKEAFLKSSVSFDKKFFYPLRVNVVRMTTERMNDIVQSSKKIERVEVENDSLHSNENEIAERDGHKRTSSRNSEKSIDDRTGPGADVHGNESESVSATVQEDKVKRKKRCVRFSSEIGYEDNNCNKKLTINDVDNRNRESPPADKNTPEDTTLLRSPSNSEPTEAPNDKTVDSDGENADNQQKSSADENERRPIKIKISKNMIKQQETYTSESQMQTSANENSSDSDLEVVTRRKTRNHASTSKKTTARKTRSGKKAILSDSDSDTKKTYSNSNESSHESTDESKSSSTSKKTSAKKRVLKRVKRVSESTSSDEENSPKSKKSAKESPINNKTENNKTADAANDNDDDDETKRTRKQIRSVWSRNTLTDATKRAEAEEKERKQRISEKQQKYNRVVAQKGGSEDPKDSRIEKLVLDYDEKTKKEILLLSPVMAPKLKKHQVQGVTFMWDACFESVERAKTDVGSGCILAHCMGLGKTLQVIALVHTLLENGEELKVRKVLVVCPLNTVLNWVNEFRHWIPDNDLYEIYDIVSCKQPSQRQVQLNQWERNGGVFVTSYEMFRNLSNPDNKRLSKKIREANKKILVDPGADIVICDEGHLLKNEKTNLSVAMNRIKTLRRIVLTGTPLQNNLKEYFCMVQFIKPNLLGTYKEYLNRFVNPITNGQYTDSTDYDTQLMRKRSHVLHKLLDGVVQRCDYSVLQPYLPPKYEYVLLISLTEVQIKLYEHYMNNLVRNAGTDTSNRAASLFADFQELQRIWTHPRVLLDRAIEAKEKAEREFITSSEAEETSDMDSFIDDEEASASSSDGESGSETKRKNKKSKRKINLVINPAAKRRKDNPPKSALLEKIITIADDENDENPKLDESSKPARKRNTSKHRKNSSSDSEVVMLNNSDESDNSGSGKQHNLTAHKRRTRSMKTLNDENSDVESPKPPTIKEWWQEYVDGDELEVISHSNKIFLLLQLLKECDQIGDKLLVFSQSLYSLNVIEYFLARIDDATQNGTTEQIGGWSGSWAKGLDYYRIDGSTSCDHRTIDCKNFNDPDNHRARLFLISTKAGGLGINLIGANRVVIFDVSWNPSHDVQSIYRVYRFGQTKPCYVYRFVTYGTMEMKIYERQVMKQSISKRVIDEQQIDRHYNQTDLQELYKFEPRLDGDRPIPLVPKDVLLGEMLQNYDKVILKYHEHQSLLENKEEECLNEEERKAAWEEFENEKKARPKSQLGVANNYFIIAALRRIIQRQNGVMDEPTLSALVDTMSKELQAHEDEANEPSQLQILVQREIQLMRFEESKRRKDAYAQSKFIMQRAHAAQQAAAATVNPQFLAAIEFMKQNPTMQPAFLQGLVQNPLYNYPRNYYNPTGN